MDHINGTLRLVIAEQALARHAPASPLQIGSELSYQIRQHEKNNKLGYYPALDYYRENCKESPEVDSQLIETFDTLLWLGEELIRSEFRTRLRSVFTQHRIIDIRHHAKALPKVRPDSPDDAHQLAAHFTPTRIKVDFQGRPRARLKEDDIEAATLFALRDSFELAEFVYYEYKEN